MLTLLVLSKTDVKAMMLNVYFVVVTYYFHSNILKYAKSGCYIIDIKYHFILSKKRFDVQKVDTRKNPTNIFTKLIPRSKFMHCLDLRNVHC